MLNFELTKLLLSLVAVLFFSLSIGHIFSKFGLPRMIGEVSAGLMLGPSLLGFFAPDLYESIFVAFPEQQKLLSVFYWLGLIFLMFIAGFKIPATCSMQQLKLIVMLILGGIALPFAFGLLVTPLFQNTTAANTIAFSLVIAAACAVTSIPVLTRIFIDLNMLPSTFANNVLGAATIQDIFLWIILSVALGIQQGHGLNSIGFVDIASDLIGTFVFIGVAIFFAPAILLFIGRLALKDPADSSLVGFTLLICLGFVCLAGVLQINLVFGALVAGVAIGRMPESRLEVVKLNITNIALWFFVPIYFAMVGLKINLNGNFDIVLIFGFFLASSIVKVVSVTIFARFTGIPFRRAVDYGVTMNARGGPGIILASLAFEATIIDEKLFIAFVLTSIVTSLAAGSWLKSRRDSLIV